MFAPPVAKAQTKAAATPTNKLASQRWTLAARQTAASSTLPRLLPERRPRLLLQRAQNLSNNESHDRNKQEADPANLTDQAPAHGVSWDFSKIPLFPPGRPHQPQAPSVVARASLPKAIGPKLVIGEVNDPLEHEADRIADQVMRMPVPELSLTSVPMQLNRKCADCEEKAPAQALQTKPADTPKASASEAPDIVHEVLRSPGQKLDAPTRAFFEPRFGRSFSDVRVHTDERAGASADAVAAHAYAVGRHIVFAPGRFDPGSAQGRRLLAHELTHVAGYPPGVPTPSGDLRISTPTEAAERHAVAVSGGSFAPAVAAAVSPGLFRQAGGLVALTGVTVNHNRVTVPPVAGLSFSATKAPANASGVTLSIVGDNATIAAGTTVNNTTGAITVAVDQTGGSAHVLASQSATDPSGATIVSTWTAPFNFTAIPSGITSTTASPSGTAGSYGGDFTHTFTSPAGGPTALERSHVNERFAAASGKTLTIKGPLGTLNITINDPGSAADGWDLDSSGTMAGPDQVGWDNTVDARPFVANASHPSPSPTLPQALTATQNFRNLTFPNQTYGAAAVASTTHRRAIEDRNDQLKAVTSANATGINQEVVEDYVGPTVFRRCRAAPVSIPVAVPAPQGGKAPAATTSTITVDAEGKTATPTFSVRPPDLGCTITPGGVLTPGTTTGTVTVRAGDTVNFDETTVTLTPPPAAPTPSPNPAPQP